jgi:hypothetical protein
MLVHETPRENSQMSLDFKISPTCNSGIFIRTFLLTPGPGKDVGFNGKEVAYREHARKGSLGLQVHGGDCWYKTIKLLPLK